MQDVKRRFNRSISNFFKIYRPLADKWMLFSNASIKPLLIARKNNGGVEIIDSDLFETVSKKVRVDT